MYACMLPNVDKYIDRQWFFVMLVLNVGRPPVKEDIVHTRISAQALKIDE